MTARRTKRIYIYTADANYIKNHLLADLDLLTNADVIHELIERCKKEKGESQVQNIVQKEFAKNWKRQIELEKQLAEINIQLSALAELSSDYCSRNRCLKTAEKQPPSRNDPAGN